MTAGEAGEAGEARPRSPRPGTRSVTVRDVAKAAGVSVATVSRVLNGKSTVAEELRVRVERASAQMRFTPHAAARALATQRFSTMGAVVPTLEEANFSVGVGALQRRLNTGGYTLLLASSNYDPQEEVRQVSALLSHGVAGMMLVGARHSDEVYQLLAAKGVPFVNTWVQDDTHPSVGFDNYAIGQALANYLLDLGHRDFGVIAQQSPQSDRAAKRVAGIRAALAARGAPGPREQLISESHKIVDGQLAFQALMETAKRPTAVICGTDSLAFGALVQAQSMGVSVPGDVSITGINDADFAEHLTPPLTTVRLEAGAVGARAADYLLARIGGQAVANSTHIPFTLVVRGSTAAPRQRTNS